MWRVKNLRDNKTKMKTATLVIFIALVTIPYLVLERDSVLSNSTYKKGFPEEDSPGLVAYMQDHYNGNRYALIKTDNGVVYSDYFDINDEEFVKSYYLLDNEVMQKNYAPVRTEEEKSHFLWNFVQDEKIVIEPIEDLATFDLPYIEFKNHQYLLIENEFINLEVDLKSEAVKKELELLKKSGQRVDIDLKSMVDGKYQLEIIEYEEEGTGRDYYYLFVDGETEEYDLVKGDDNSLENWLARDESKGLKGAIPKADEEAGHLLLREYGSIYNNYTKEIINFHESDYLSKRGDFVYLNGDKDSIEFGKQKIQTLDDYLLGNENYYAEFRLSHSKVKKLGDIAKAASLDGMKIVYFDKDFIVYTLSHSMLISNFESFNFIVDLQNDKRNPDIYVEYLGDDHR